MTVVVDFTPAISWRWTCNRCHVESTPMHSDTPTPLGWMSYDADGQRCHLCCECRIRYGLSPGFHAFGGKA